jgi:hypothetical protein
MCFESWQVSLWMDRMEHVGRGTGGMDGEDPSFCGMGADGRPRFGVEKSIAEQ